ncbi:uncharacterized protein LOC133824935 [Humulus lupulus]|uniref:uncharacterized protein LOC133824935 n=1 Tax=Humulus lupulus TaxID=3486 RepID=UPI002B40FE94|nr:uncharacterized protein LOC133824935 [Humulus lupulus]
MARTRRHLPSTGPDLSNGATENLGHASSNSNRFDPIAPEEPEQTQAPIANSPIAPSPIGPQPSIAQPPIHPSSIGQQPPTVQTPIPPMLNKNFLQWRCDFKISIGAKNKTAFLNGSLPQPCPSDSHFSARLHCNQMVMSWIIHSVSPEIKSSIMFLDIAAAMWMELNNRFDQGNGPRIFELNESLISLHQGDDFVSAYFTKIKSMWEEINQLRPRTPCTYAASVDNFHFLNQDQVLQFLTGLNESFHAVRA